MKTAIFPQQLSIENNETECKFNPIQLSFRKISPFWPLKNLIAVNPLQGLEEMPMEDALCIGAAYFQQSDLPKPMKLVNRETIKWLQVYFDEGQATISMPFREKGLYNAWRKLALHDSRLHANEREKKQWLKRLPETAEEGITESMKRLNIAEKDYEIFLTLMLTTLPGWASYVKYRTEWAGVDVDHSHPVTQADYLAVRLIITSLIWPGAKALLRVHEQSLRKSKIETSPLEKIQKIENNYRLPLLKQLASQPLKKPHKPEAQFVFCIDVRSEPFRRNLEAVGDYQTFGFAGFFGIPIKITNPLTGESYASCPVLLSPKHEIKEASCSFQEKYVYDLKGYKRLAKLKQLYQFVKYAFTTPFALAETIGIASGIWLGIRSIAPLLASKIKTAATRVLCKPLDVKTSLENIPLVDQIAYAEGALKMIGLTHHFAPIVVFCGHGSTTQNNPYATALDCGACGGRQGASNARILAAILNRAEVRNHLIKKGIIIPKSTHFIAAKHNTTTDEVTLFSDISQEGLKKLRMDLKKAQIANSYIRLQQMQQKKKRCKAALHTLRRSQDWAQVRPEWGLARNAVFIVAPRDITTALNLQGRCFLHSYDYTQDPKGSSLTTILTAPMVVAEWINMQYLFSTLDNVAFGSGSKITKNITGKIGIMQGNASDLMTGLPLQSVHISDKEAYHEPQRLMTVVYAPRKILDPIIQTQPVLQKLFRNGWVQLTYIDPKTRNIYFLQRDLSWKSVLN
ncbi:MAG: DUF2309 domain-containing protein [Simkaniaceae bacterium]